MLHLRAARRRCDRGQSAKLDSKFWISLHCFLEALECGPKLAKRRLGYNCLAQCGTKIVVVCVVNNLWNLIGAIVLNVSAISRVQVHLRRYV